MADSYSAWDGYERYRIRMVVDETWTNAGENSSGGTWSLILYGSSGWNYYGWTTYTNAYINGTLVYEYNGVNPGGSWSPSGGVTLASGGWGVYHESDGSKALSWSAHHNGTSTPDSYGPANALNTSGSMWLTDFPRKPSAPTGLSTTAFAADSFGVNYTRGSNNGAGLDADQARWSTASDFSTVAWTDGNGPGTSGPAGYSNPSGASPRFYLQPNTRYYVQVRSHNSVGWSDWSSSVSGVTLGHPTAPLGLSATASTTVTGRVALSWTQPTTTGNGGITGYTIYRNGSQIGTTTGTGTTYTDSGLTPFTTYSYTVAARNAYSGTVGGAGAQSGADTVVAQGPPSAPRNLVAIEDGSIPGKVDLSWDAPTNTGTGGITGYRINFSGGALITNQSGTGTTYSVTGLAPGSTYSFQVFARNALGDAQSVWSVGSNTAVATPIGEPNAPSSFSLAVNPMTSNRLTLNWTAPPGTLSGYNIFSRVGTTDTLLQSINASHTSFSVDNLTAGSAQSFVVRARTVYTDTLPDGYPGNWGGPASVVRTATPTNDSNQTVPNVGAATSGTNAVFAGTYTLSAVSSNTMSYAKNAANIPTAASGGSVANTTNAIFNGVFTITGSPAAAKFTYNKTNANVPLLGVFNGTITNNTNTSMNINGVSVFGVNAGAHTFNYNKAGDDLATVAVPINAEGNTSVVVNVTNASFNVTGKIITAITEYTVSYNQTGSNVALSNAAGTITNTTNRDIYNGVHTILSVLSHNSFTYEVYPNAEVSGVRTWYLPNGTVEREDSAAVLEVRYRSGWIG